MTLPPLHELKRLQAEATPGPWACWVDVPHEPKYDGAKVETEEGEEIASVHTPADGRMVAFAPILLAEVIRMREEITDVRDMARQLSTNPTIMTMERLRFDDIADDLTRILEGEE